MTHNNSFQIFFNINHIYNLHILSALNKNSIFSVEVENNAHLFSYPFLTVWTRVCSMPHMCDQWAKLILLMALIHLPSTDHGTVLINT